MDTTENRRKVIQQYLRLFGLIILIVIFVSGIISFADKIRQFSPSQPDLTVKTDTASTLAVSVRVINTACEDAEKIDFSLVELSINGGEPPYDLTITNSKSELSGPYPIVKDNSPVRIKVYGGDYFTSVVRSSAGEIWSGTIGLPSEAEICKITPTPTLEPTVTETIKDTPAPANTEFVIPSPTSTPTVTPPVDLPPTKTKSVEPEKTGSPKPTQTIHTLPPQITFTLPSQFTATKPLQITNTPPVQFTDTPRATSTSIPTATQRPTSTLIPQPTATHQPPTITPTPINPNPRQCEDGIDNDGDTFIDYPADPDCNKPSDPHENK